MEKIWAHKFDDDRLRVILERVLNGEAKATSLTLMVF